MAGKRIKVNPGRRRRGVFVDFEKDTTHPTLSSCVAPFRGDGLKV